MEEPAKQELEGQAAEHTEHGPERTAEQLITGQVEGSAYSITAELHTGQETSRRRPGG